VKRAESSTEGNVRYYFDNLCSALRELELTNSPAQIWNCDETGVSAQGRCMERVICPKGMAAKVQRSACRENVSIMGCINAAGGYIPPMYIYAGARRKMEWLPGAPDGAVCAVTESSNVNTDLFLIWFEWFVDQLPPVRPQLLVLDGHFAHVSVATVKYGIDRDAYLFVLPAHTSHFLQPLDVAVYQPFKALYEREVQRYPLNNCGALPVKDNIAGMTHDAFVMAFSDKNIRRAFAIPAFILSVWRSCCKKWAATSPAPPQYPSAIMPWSCHNMTARRWMFAR